MQQIEQAELQQAQQVAESAGKIAPALKAGLLMNEKDLKQLSINYKTTFDRRAVKVLEDLKKRCSFKLRFCSRR